MTAKQIGNKSAFITGVGGVGKGYVPDTSLGWVTIVGKSGDVSYVGVSGLNRAETNLGYFFQGGPGVTATAEFTLANESLATDGDPEVQAMVPWGNSLTIDSTIKLAVDSTSHPLAFTAIKITLGADGEVYVGAR